MNRYKGYTTLISVIVIGAIATAITVTLLLSGYINSENSRDVLDSAQARAIANACSERALSSLRLDLLYEGNENYSIDSGTCTISPLEGWGNYSRTIDVEGLKGEYIYRVRIVVGQVYPSMEIVSWEEL